MTLLFSLLPSTDSKLTPGTFMMTEWSLTPCCWSIGLNVSWQGSWMLLRIWWEAFKSSIESWWLQWLQLKRNCWQHHWLLLVSPSTHLDVFSCWGWSAWICSLLPSRWRSAVLASVVRIRFLCVCFSFLISGPCGPSIIFALVCHGLSFGWRTLLGHRHPSICPYSCFEPLSLHFEVVFLIQVVRVAKISGRKTLGTVGLRVFEAGEHVEIWGYWFLPLNQEWSLADACKWRGESYTNGPIQLVKKVKCFCKGWKFCGGLSVSEVLSVHTIETSNVLLLYSLSLSPSKLNSQVSIGRLQLLVVEGLLPRRTFFAK